ncbi:hypothetical protein TRVA0_009S02872 [Trichomonascus vanleenenianus]|uniref:RING-H2 finger protein n=1 Tax=Trichomonascus vanleenenianus TaxID=2268995 RepID=UPI003ECA306E
MLWGMASCDDQPALVGELNVTQVISTTNQTGQLPSDFILSANITRDSSMIVRADISAMTSTTGVSFTTVNGIKSICSGYLVLQRDDDNYAWNEIVMVSCDDRAKAGATFDALSTQNPPCTLMYSLTSQGCNFTNMDSQLTTQLGTVFTMLSRSASYSFVDRLRNTSAPEYAYVSPNSTTYEGNSGSGSSSGSSSHSSSSTTAMAVLYAITGLIAVLFLFVIVSGAIRVHKHPERYGLGPADAEDNESQGFGSSSQVYANRAKGLARAVLDSIPLVRFQVDANSQSPRMDDSRTEDKEARAESYELQRSANSSDPNIVTTTNVEASRVLIASREEPDCPICFEGFKDGDILRVLPCKHKFHAECVDPWLLNSSSLCPLCRVDLSLSREEQVSEAPPNTVRGENGEQIVIPPGYEIETSMFNRFLDIWNAQLLPRESRQQVLARFHHEAELRRQLTSSRQSDEEQNRSRWVRFVNSRRMLHRRQQSLTTDQAGSEGATSSGATENGSTHQIASNDH